MQPGVGYNLTAGQAGITLAIDDPQLAGDPEQFRVTVIKTGSGYGVQCRKGFVLWPGYGFNGPWALATYKGEVQKFYCFPDSSKTTGPFTYPDDSPLVDLGGYVQIQPGSVEGGSDSWGVYLIGSANSDGTQYKPYLAIFSDGSDADTKSNYFNGSNDQIIFRNVIAQTRMDVETPTGTSSILFAAGGANYLYNYNCQRYKVATLAFEGSTFVVTQHLLGQVTIPYPVNNGGDYPYETTPPSWLGAPYYDTELANWWGAWSGYTKNSSGATVEV